MSPSRLGLVGLLALLAAALAGCGHAPDGRSVQQAVDEAVAGAPQP
jgi:hypothetical protein